MEELVIPTETVKERFKQYLEIEGNSNIFFSGKFGTGKTFFLKDFFASSDDYEVFHLYPVNYQISSNDNILELIKYDILVELLNKNEEIFQENIVDGLKESSLLFFSWCKSKTTINSTLNSIINTGQSLINLSPDPIISSFGKLGRPLKEILRVDKEFQYFKEKYKKGEKGIVEEYTKRINKGISESDYFSELLGEKIFQQKKGKKSVLILDDLDRIDPEHIFRILNILAGYFEKDMKINKFGFDSIIIVADYRNIENIFYHKYGGGADFSGYMDKFFCIAPFYFNNKEAILNTLNLIVRGIKNEKSEINFNQSEYAYDLLYYIFSMTINSNNINLRELLKATRYQLNELENDKYKDNPSFNIPQIVLDRSIMAMIKIFSNPNLFIDKIKDIKSSNHLSVKEIRFEIYIRTLLELLEYKIPVADNENITYKDYLIQKNKEDARSGIKVLNNRRKELFCDLLIDYVNRINLSNK